MSCTRKRASSETDSISAYGEENDQVKKKAPICGVKPRKSEPIADSNKPSTVALIANAAKEAAPALKKFGEKALPKLGNFCKKQSVSQKGKPAKAVFRAAGGLCGLLGGLCKPK